MTVEKAPVSNSKDLGDRDQAVFQDDPLPGLWAQWESLEGARPNETDADAGVRIEKQTAVEKEMAKHVPSTPAGAVALARLLRDYDENGAPPDGRQERICDNLIAGLERLTQEPTSVTSMKGNARTGPDAEKIKKMLFNLDLHSGTIEITSEAIGKVSELIADSPNDDNAAVRTTLFKLYEDLSHDITDLRKISLALFETTR